MPSSGRPRKVDVRLGGTANRQYFPHQCYSPGPPHLILLPYSFSTHDLTSYITLGWTEEITVICISGLGWGAVGGCGEKHTALLNDFHLTLKQIYMQGASKKVPFRIYHGRDQSALGQIIIFTCSSCRYPLSLGWLASWDGREKNNDLTSHVHD